MPGYYDNLENHDGKSVANPVTGGVGTYATTAANNAGAATAGQNDYSQQIQDLYDKQKEAQLAQIQASYDQTKRQLAEAGEKIPAAYQQQQNALAGDYERNRANMNERMALNGINTGAGSQAALAQNAVYQSNSANLRQAQADAQAALERELANQEAQYQASIRQALADNDYQRAVALMKEMQDSESRAREQQSWALEQAKILAAYGDYSGFAQLYGQSAADSMRAKEQQSDLMEKAKLLAGYGDFSGYAQLYGQDTADNMRALWMAQNPVYAYYIGALSADDYYKLTGQKAPGTSSGYTRTYTPPVDDLPPVREIPTGATPSNNYAARDIMDARTAEEAIRAYNNLPDGYIDSLTPSQQNLLRDRLRLFGITG